MEISKKDLNTKLGELDIKLKQDIENSQKLEQKKKENFNIM